MTHFNQRKAREDVAMQDLTPLLYAQEDICAILKAPKKLSDR